jgi:hypothetical protein
VRSISREPIIAAEKKKLNASKKKQDFSVSQATSAPATTGDSRRTA